MLSIPSGVTVHLERLNIFGSMWGMSTVSNAGTLYLRDSAVSSPTFYDRLVNTGVATITDSTFAGSNGRDIRSDAGVVRVSSSTFAGPSNLYSTGGVITVKNSIVSGTGTGCQVASGGSIVAVGVNLSDDTTCIPFGFSLNDTNPLLDRPGSYGGPTQTQSLAGDPHPSPARNAAADCTDLDGNPLATDQRGFPRPVGADCDLGAFERQPFDYAPQTLTVTTVNDYGSGSLRQIVSEALHNDRITFAVTGAITLNNTLVLDKNLTILGPAGSISLQPQDYFVVLSIPSGVTVHLERLNIFGSMWGMSTVSNAGTLYLRDSAVSSPLSTTGCQHRRCHHHQQHLRGPTSETSEAMLELSRSAAAHSRVPAISPVRAARVITVKNIIAAGTGTGCQVASGGRIVAVGVNLSDDATCIPFGFSLNDTNPLLGTLGNHGGPTQTYPLQLNPIRSPAIDAVTDCTDLDGNPLLTDQRRFGRPVDGDGQGGAACDLGAYESGASPVLDAIETAYGTARGQAVVYLFGQTYTVAWFSDEASPGENELIYLPFYGVPSDFDMSSFVADSDLGTLILESYAFQENLPKWFPYYILQLQELEEYYRPQAWWREAVGEYLPLISKRRVGWVRFANMSSSLAQELFGFMVSHGATAKESVFHLAEALYSQFKLRHINDGEIRALLLYAISSGEELDRLNTMEFLQEGLPDLSPLFFAADLAELKNAGQALFQNVPVLLHNLSSAAKLQDTVQMAQQLTNLLLEIDNFGLNLVNSEVGTTLLFDDFNLEEEILVWAWLYDAHNEALGELSRDNLDNAEFIRQVHDGELTASTPANRERLHNAYYDFYYRYAYSLLPIHAEAFMVDTLYLTKIRNHIDPVRAWWFGATDENIEESRDGFNLVNMEAAGMQAGYRDYLFDSLRFDAVYQGAYQALLMQETGELLEFDAPETVTVSVGSSVNVPLRFVNGYSNTVSSVTVNAATLTREFCTLSTTAGGRQHLAQWRSNDHGQPQRGSILVPVRGRPAFRVG
ncbi:MAG: hypothetical protein IPK19_39750 [Chloroflexi bacterium]|nr:hypothetical protein [Chloroflexota bacterium]